MHMRPGGESIHLETLVCWLISWCAQVHVWLGELPPALSRGAQRAGTFCNFFLHFCLCFTKFNSNDMQQILHQTYCNLSEQFEILMATFESAIKQLETLKATSYNTIKSQFFNLISSQTFCRQEIKEEIVFWL